MDKAGDTIKVKFGGGEIDVVVPAMNGSSTVIMPGGTELEVHGPDTYCDFDSQYMVESECGEIRGCGSTVRKAFKDFEKDLMVRFRSDAKLLGYKLVTERT